MHSLQQNPAGTAVESLVHVLLELLKREHLGVSSCPNPIVVLLPLSTKGSHEKLSGVSQMSYVSMQV